MLGEMNGAEPSPVPISAEGCILLTSLEALYSLLLILNNVFISVLTLLTER